MKAISKTFNHINKAILALTLFIISTIATAQDKLPEIEVDIDKKESYGSWWMWAVGIAVFIIIIVALTNRGRRRD